MASVDRWNSRLGKATTGVERTGGLVGKYSAYNLLRQPKLETSTNQIIVLATLSKLEPAACSTSALT